MGGRQTVWLEKVPAQYITGLSIEANLTTVVIQTSVDTHSSSLHQKEQAPFPSDGSKKIQVVAVKVVVETAPGTVVATGTASIVGSKATVALVIPHPQLWSPESPFLYNLTVSLVPSLTKPSPTDIYHDQYDQYDQYEYDQVRSYVGLAISKSYFAPLHIQNGAKSGFELCFGPSTLGAGAKTRLESGIKKFTPHCICRYFGMRTVSLGTTPAATKSLFLNGKPFFASGWLDQSWWYGAFVPLS